MATVCISLGTSIERERNLQAGLTALENVFGKLSLSSLFESEAVGFNGPAFYNMVILLNTDENITFVSRILKTIELDNGREIQAKKFSPRTLDLDLLIYDDLVLEEPAQIPRNEIIHNAFVLWPLAEVAGQLLHPILKKSYQQLWQEYDKTSQQLKKVPFTWRVK